MLYQTLDPMHWPMPLYYMDVGCFFHGDGNYPVRYYLDSYAQAHLTTGSNGLVYMPGHETPSKLCNMGITKTDGITLSPDGSGQYYASPVCATEDEAAQIVAGLPPYRWTGRSRLWAQAKQGMGLTLTGICDPDYEGLLISTDHYFYKAAIGSNSITITPLKTEACLVEQLNDPELLEEDRPKILALALAQLVVDGGAEPYDLSIPVRQGSPLAYGWHWSYTDNEASIVTYYAPGTWTETESFYTDLYRVVFTVPEEGAEVSASVTKEEADGRICLGATSIFWTWDGSQLRNDTFLAPMISGTNYGDSTACYVWYRLDGTRSVLRYSYTEGAWQDGDDYSVPSGRYCLPHTQKLVDGHTQPDSGTWSIDGGPQTSLSTEGTRGEIHRKWFWDGVHTITEAYITYFGDSRYCGTDAIELTGSFWSKLENYNYDLEIEDKDYTGGAGEVAMMVPHNPDGLYLLEQKWDKFTSQRHHYHPREHTKSAYTLEEDDPENSYTDAAQELGWTWGWSHKDEYEDIDSQTKIHVYGIEANDNGAPNEPLLKYFRPPEYGGDNTEGAVWKIQESFGGQYRYSIETYLDSISSLGLDGVQEEPGYSLKFAGWS